MAAKADEERRVYIGYIGQDEVFNIFLDDPLKRDPNGTWTWCIRHLKNVPADAKLVAVQYDFARQAFAFLISHPSFSLVSPGEMPDAFMLSYETVQLAVKPHSPYRAVDPSPVA